MSTSTPRLQLLSLALISWSFLPSVISRVDYSGTIAAETSGARFQRALQARKLAEALEELKTDPDIIFLAFNKDSKPSGEEISTHSKGPDDLENWNKDSDTKILIHGWQESPHMSIHSAQTIKNAYFSDGRPENIVIVNWSEQSLKPDYKEPQLNVYRIGNSVAKFIKQLVLKKFVKDYANIHVIGYNLGAHIAGVAGHYIKKKGNKIGRITGLDPNWAGFDNSKEESKRLTPDDAAFVDVMHCNIGQEEGYFGADFPMGTADFYPNGGVNQPGCESPEIGGEYNVLCSTAACFKIYAKSVLGYKLESCPCHSWSAFGKDECGTNCDIPMGDMTPTTAKGTYFLRTRGDLL